MARISKLFSNLDPNSIKPIPTCLFAILSLFIPLFGKLFEVREMNPPQTSRQRALRDIRTRKDRPPPETDEEEAARQKKVVQDREKKAENKWKESLKTRKCTLERQICSQTLAGSPFVQRIRERGLEFWFNEVNGYVKAWVVNFYMNMECDCDNAVIETSVNDRSIIVTPDTIAFEYGYVRPPKEQITYPRPENINPLDKDMVMSHVFERGVQEPHGGSLTSNFRTVNKALHYNLFPRGREKFPGDEEIALGYVFMSYHEELDCAKMVFDQIMDFKERPRSKMTFPFPFLITKLCLRAGCKMSGQYKWGKEKGDHGPINETTEKKSTANVRRNQPQQPEQAAQRAEPSPPPGPSSSQPPKKTVSVTSWLKKICCQNAEIQQDQRRMDHKLDHMIRQQGAQEHVPYEPLEGEWGARTIGEHISPPVSSDDEEATHGGASTSAWGPWDFGSD